MRPLLLQRDRRGAARTIVTFVEAHLAIYKALIAGGSGETVRAEMLRQTMTTLAATRQRQPEGPLDDFIFFHLISAILNQLAWWLRHERAIDAEAMAEIIERTVLIPCGDLRLSPPVGL